MPDSLGERRQGGAVRRFNTPPGWPPPPNVRWRPPRGWAPHESWPAAPAGWAFWINEHGRRVAGPLGRFGGPSLAWPVAGVGVLVALLVFASCGPLGSDGDPVAGSGSATPGVSASDDPTGGSTPSASPDESESSTPSPTTSIPTDAATSSPSPTPTPGSPSTTPTPTTTSETPGRSTPAPTPSAVYYKNCGAVRAAGADPLHRGEPGYSPRLDPDGDGVACARGG